MQVSGPCHLSASRHILLAYRRAERSREPIVILAILISLNEIVMSYCAIMHKQLKGFVQFRVSCFGWPGSQRPNAGRSTVEEKGIMKEIFKGSGHEAALHYGNNTRSHQGVSLLQSLSRKNAYRLLLPVLSAFEVNLVRSLSNFPYRTLSSKAS